VNAIRDFIQSLIKMTPREKGEKIFEFLNTSVSNAKEFDKVH
jgi:hypothetical protein